MKVTRNVAAAWTAGLIAGLLGAAAFLVTHAVIIVPIWQAARGGALIAAVLGGTAIAWSFEELRHSGTLSLTLRSGLLYGGLLWLLIVPMTALGAILRVSEMRVVLGRWEVVVEVTLAAATGFVAAWALTRRIRPAAALALTTVVLSLIMGGPIPVVNSNRAAQLFGAFLLIYPVAGVGFVMMRRALSHLAERHRRPRDSAAMPHATEGVW